MISPEVKKLFFDIDRAGSLIVTFVGRKTRDEFMSDKLLQSAVERQFEIIGEALGKALKFDEKAGTLITGSKRIIAFRNRLIHGYSSISPRVVWDIIQQDLPLLMSDVKRTLE